MADDGSATLPTLGRRKFLHAAASLGLATPLLAGTAAPAIAAPRRVDQLNNLPVRPRDDWAGGRPATGPLKHEAPGDVRFLLVHHTASPNRYSAGDVISLIQGFYAAHTRSKGWPDVAYNFFVDRYGGIWEGRMDSLSGPVIGDATGGNQGFSQLCCLIGDHQTEPPTGEALASLVKLLAALADVYAVDTSQGATTSFVSRGSNRWAAGRLVVTSTIAGHRDMSQTVCPGDAAYALLGSVIRPQVHAARRRAR